MLDGSTIGYMLDAGFDLWAQCYSPDCRRMAKLDLGALAARLGREHSTLRKDLCPRLKCSACGSKDVGTWSAGGGFGPGGGPYGGERR